MKNNYKNDVLAASMGGVRRYKLVNNPDGTVSFVDNTKYDSLGDEFGAIELNEMADEFNGLVSDVNTTTNRVATLESYKEISVPVSAWTSGSGISDFPVYANVSATWAKANLVPLFVDMIPSSSTENRYFTEAENDAKAILNPLVNITNGYVTFYASETPTTNLKFRIGGV